MCGSHRNPKIVRRADSSKPVGSLVVGFSHAVAATARAQGGWELLTELRKAPRLANVPVVLMWGSPDIAQRAKESGAVAVMRKPAEPQMLLRIVDHFI